MHMEQSYCFIVSEDALLVTSQNDKLGIPCQADLKRIEIALHEPLRIGRLYDIDCIAARPRTEELLLELPLGFALIKLRQLFGLIDDESYHFALRAAHILGWRKNNRFCGRCGSEMANVTKEVAVQCSGCGHIVYPRISPAIIVAVTRGNEILLARSSRFPLGRFSVIAGFLEPGETLEECVRREVKEEVGIEVDRIRYFGNQPWPFPDSQMIGFTAKYAGGKITIDNHEIVAANWFRTDNLPDIPPKDSIARRLIDDFVQGNTSNTTTNFGGI
ncbi:hypothetical protein AXX12_18250 [Anaerosporomusa subterranea]|uniref:NAD(+) diphosphatase n=2 Tax=Anaerosporomusa subterranea TaxID=1794912 RepID=A0A154BUZ8_ANASB|nr:hypothetical protein AXX12_18250 [Anaerosporomusa subterranea]